MPFTADTFKPLLGMATSVAPRMFAYKTDDTIADLQVANYWNSMANDLNQGDQLFIHAEASGTPVMEVFSIRSVISGVVTVQRIAA